jgi:hypothetical protein
MQEVRLAWGSGSEWVYWWRPGYSKTDGHHISTEKKKPKGTAGLRREMRLYFSAVLSNYATLHWNLYKDFSCFPSFSRAILADNLKVPWRQAISARSL